MHTPLHHTACRWAAGRVNKGDFENDKFVGQGACVRADGAWVSGNWTYIDAHGGSFVAAVMHDADGNGLSVGIFDIDGMLKVRCQYEAVVERSLHLSTDRLLHLSTFSTSLLV